MGTAQKKRSAVLIIINLKIKRPGHDNIIESIVE